MTNPRHCTDCGTPLAAKESGSLCPKCLMKIGLAMPAGVVPPPDGDGQRLFGPYRILRLLGKGGMGSVYEAEDRSTGLRIALKVLGQTLDHAEIRSRFLREGKLAASVRHPNVVGVVSAGEVEGTPVIAMELLHDGTLAEQVKKHGPMSPEDAVQAVLGIIDGLEAAHQAGVLHRDVKPANCFISADGRAKVGDFGLSMSTLARTEHSLTMSGAVLGTPAFAAPEQLRGEDLDVRADIYGVGATLYYLLTEKHIHTADSLVAMIASVLTKTPTSPRSLRPEVPAALSRVVMRCLERNRAQRFPDYAALKAALYHFRPEAPSPGILGLRFVAGVVDSLICSGITGLTLSSSIDEAWPRNDSWPSFVTWLVGMVFMILYFAVMEGRWGTTPGKMICGLRVSLAGGGYPGFRRAFLRSCIFHVDVILSAAGFFLLLRWMPAWESMPLDSFIGFTVFCILCSSMRMRNGYATLHDLASGTRVVALRSPEEDLRIAGREAPRPDSGSPERMEPFIVCRRHGSLIEAWDDTLDRSVWIVMRPEGFPELSPRRRALNRQGRLQWLQGSRGEKGNWDAFEAPAGQPLSELENGRQPWVRVRRWLADLANEFTEAKKDGTAQDSISLDRIWITSRGHAIWLEFPFPGQTVCEEHPVTETGDFQFLLARIAGNVLAPGAPMHAMSLLETFSKRRLDSPAMVAGNLQATLAYPATLTRRKRLVTLLLWPVMALAIGVIGTFAAVEGEDGKTPRVTMSAVFQSDGEGVSSTTESTMETETYLAMAGVIFIIILVVGGVVSGVWTVATGVPPGLHLFGLVLVDGSGKVAPRWLAACRSFLTGGVTVLLGMGVVLVIIGIEDGRSAPIFAGSVPLLIVFGLGTLAFIHPTRSVADRILGTSIIPR